MPAKVWIGRRALNVLLALLASCECGHGAPLDAGVEASVGMDASIDAGPDAGSPDTGLPVDAGPVCPITPGSWRFIGTGAPLSCGMFQFIADLSSFADARGSRECTTDCSCASTQPAEPSCEIQWSETCPALSVQCTFTRVDAVHILGHCDDGMCATNWTASPSP